MIEIKPYLDNALRSLATIAIAASSLAEPSLADPFFPCPTEKPLPPTPSPTVPLKKQLFLPMIKKAEIFMDPSLLQGDDKGKQGDDKRKQGDDKRKSGMTKVELIGKVLGASWGDPPEVTIFNGPGTPNYSQVIGTDLGPTARYGDRYYSLLGDTILPGMLDNFLVPYFNCSNSTTLPFVSGYLNKRDGTPTRALVNRATEPLPNSQVLPTALTNITWRGEEHMVAHYMNTPQWSNFNIAYSTMAKYRDDIQLFTPYKVETNIWQASGRGVAQFAMASFWPDEKNGYLYMVGASNDRFGGAKLGRIHLDNFLDPSNKTDWQYYLGENRWSEPTKSLEVINNQAAWLIPPKDPGWTLEKGLSQTNVDWCTLMTVTEHGLIHDPSSGKFIFMYGDANCPPHGIYIHTADAITGPWTNPPMRAEMPYPTWDYYGISPIPNTVKDNPSTNSVGMHIFSSTYKNYGIYGYKLNIPVTGK